MELINNAGFDGLNEEIGINILAEKYVNDLVNQHVYIPMTYSKKLIKNFLKEQNIDYYETNSK